MRYNLHITDNCNLNCIYCYENKRKSKMSIDNIKKIIDICINNNDYYNQITFFGGEPLLEYKTIKETLLYVKNKHCINKKFIYVVNTNGTIINKEIIKTFKENNFLVGYSIDGNKQMHNLNRKTLYENNNTYDLIEKNLKELLVNNIDIVAMLTITLNNVQYLCDGIENLLNLGVTKIACAVDYTADWKTFDFDNLKNEYEKIKKLYIDMIHRKKIFKIEPLDTKMNTHIYNKDACYKCCSMGLDSAEIGTDGNIYPCLQFMYLPEYIIGNCEEGINNQKCIEILNSKEEYKICKQCKLKNRCRHTCSCINKQTTGNISIPSGFSCQYEKLTIRIADEIAEQLYKERDVSFINNKYN